MSIDLDSPHTIRKLKWTTNYQSVFIVEQYGRYWINIADDVIDEYHVISPELARAILQEAADVN